MFPPAKRNQTDVELPEPHPEQTKTNPALGPAAEPTRSKHCPLLKPAKNRLDFRVGGRATR